MCHVMVIEDDWLVADHIVTLVERAGATSVCRADTADDAVAAARVQRPALIMSDVRLSAGTGPLAVRRIFAEYGTIPVIFVTGTLEDCRPCPPPSAILTKPIVDATVIATFRQLAPL